jgi:hypothetical protein
MSVVFMNAAETWMHQGNTEYYHHSCFQFSKNVDKVIFGMLGLMPKFG